MSVLRALDSPRRGSLPAARATGATCRLLLTATVAGGLVLAASLVFPCGVAQTASAPAPGLDATKLYAHRSTSGSDELSGWMNTLADDGDDSAMGPAAACNNNPTGLQGVPFTGVPAVDDAAWGEDLDRTYSLSLPSGLATGLTLDATRGVQASIAFGATSCGGHPQIESTLKAGDLVVAHGVVNHTYAPGSPYPVEEFTMTVATTTLPPGPLLWVIHLTGTFYGAGFLGVGDPQGHSSIDLPIVPTPVPVTTTYHVLSGPKADAVLPQGSSGIHVFNWTTTKTTLAATWQATMTAGSARLQVEDGAAASVLDEVLQASGPGQRQVSGAAGTWRITITLADFAGTVEAHLAAVATPAAPTGTGSTDHPGDTAAPADSSGPPAATAASTSQAASSSQKSPGPGLALLAGAVGLAVVLRRRRA